MTLVSNTTVNQQLLGLAGRENGSSPIGFWDRWNAGSGHTHPVSNCVYAAVGGTLDGLGLLTSGLLAYPLIDASARNSIFGSVAAVCTTCGLSAKKIADFSLQLSNLFGRRQTMSPLEQFATPYIVGGSVLMQCATVSDAVADCRVVNYLGAMLGFVEEHSHLITGGTVALIALLVFRNINRYETAEKVSEASMIKDLKGRFLTIAQQLEAHAADADQAAEVQQLATAILVRRIEIEKEILDLGLPSLSKDNVSVITEPLFDAVAKVRGQSLPVGRNQVDDLPA